MSKKNLKVIVITGTPGTGKTTLARELSLSTYSKHLELSKFIQNSGLKENFDKEKDCMVVDTHKLSKALQAYLSKQKAGQCIIIDGHLSHYLSKKLITLCIVTKCGLKPLKKRLIARGYSPQKVRENLDSEIFDICLIEATQKKLPVLVVDTTKKLTKISLKSIISQINSL